MTYEQWTARYLDTGQQVSPAQLGVLLCDSAFHRLVTSGTGDPRLRPGHPALAAGLTTPSPCGTKAAAFRAVSDRPRRRGATSTTSPSGTPTKVRPAPRTA